MFYRRKFARKNSFGGASSRARVAPDFYHFLKIIRLVEKSISILIYLLDRKWTTARPEVKWILKEKVFGEVCSLAKAIFVTISSHQTKFSTQNSQKCSTLRASIKSNGNTKSKNVNCSIDIDMMMTIYHIQVRLKKSFEHSEKSLSNENWRVQRWESLVNFPVKWLLLWMPSRGSIKLVTQTNSDSATQIELQCLIFHLTENLIKFEIAESMLGVS